jgi:hypothetical protein
LLSDNSISDLEGLHRLIDSVSFQVGHRNLSKADVSGLSLLNYRELRHQSIRPVDSALDHAELSIYYSGQGTDTPANVTKTIVHRKRLSSPQLNLHAAAALLLIRPMLVSQATTLKVDESNTRVVIEGVECLGFNHDRQVNRLEKADVVFHVTSREGQVTRLFMEDSG